MLRMETILYTTEHTRTKGGQGGKGLSAIVARKGVASQKRNKTYGWTSGGCTLHGPPAAQEFVEIPGNHEITVDPRSLGTLPYVPCRADEQCSDTIDLSCVMAGARGKLCVSQNRPGAVDLAEAFPGYTAKAGCPLFHSSKHQSIKPKLLLPM